MCNTGYGNGRRPLGRCELWLLRQVQGMPSASRDSHLQVMPSFVPLDFRASVATLRSRFARHTPSSGAPRRVAGGAAPHRPPFPLPSQPVPATPAPSCTALRNSLAMQNAPAALPSLGRISASSARIGVVAGDRCVRLLARHGGERRRGRRPAGSSTAPRWPTMPLRSRWTGR